jgi:hypothetical protein
MAFKPFDFAALAARSPEEVAAERERVSREAEERFKAQIAERVQQIEAISQVVKGKGGWDEKFVTSLSYKAKSYGPAGFLGEDLLRLTEPQLEQIKRLMATYQINQVGEAMMEINLVKLYTVDGEIYVDTRELANPNRAYVTAYTADGEKVKETNKTDDLPESAVHQRNLFGSMELAIADFKRTFGEDTYREMYTKALTTKKEQELGAKVDVFDPRHPNFKEGQAMLHDESGAYDRLDVEERFAPADPVDHPTPLAVKAAMEHHYRDQLHDSNVSSSAAWKEAKISLRFLNHVSPLLLGVIQRPGSSADLEERKAALAYLTASTDALANVMSTALAPNQHLNEYDRIELNSVLTHLIGLMWEKSARQDPQEKIDALLKTVSAMYHDKDFLNRHTTTAHRMMEASGYLKVDSKETMETRLRLSIHQAVMRFYTGVVDERICNSKGVPFTYGLARKDVVQRLTLAFDTVVNELIGKYGFADSLSNDQRTSVMQAWIRHASDMFHSEYVAQTVRKMDWFRKGLEISDEEYRTRFSSVKDSFDDVVHAVAKFTTETMEDLLVVADYQGAHPKEVPTQAFDAVESPSMPVQSMQP